MSNDRRDDKRLGAYVFALLVAWTSCATADDVALPPQTPIEGLELRSVFDFLSPAQVTAIKDDDYADVPDIAPPISAALKDPKTGPLLFPKGVYRPQTPIDLETGVTERFSPRIVGQGVHLTKIVGDFPRAFVFERPSDPQPNHLRDGLIANLFIQNTGAEGGAIRLRQFIGIGDPQH